jgi:hypothetical protein
MSQPKQQTADSGSARQWVQPTVRRLSAGSAEDGGGTVPDGGLPS